MGTLLLIAPAGAVVLLARWWAARALGMRGIGFFGGHIEDPGAAAWWRRALVVLASLVSSYLVAGVLFAVALLVGGRIVLSSEVSVLPGKPAATAGMESGDRVVSIAGTPVATWEELAAAISRHPDEPTEVVVVRGGEERRFTVTPERASDGRGKIGITTTVSRREPVGLGTALGAAVTEPARVLVASIKGLASYLTGRAPGELSGPARIVKETAKAAKSGPSDLLELIAALMAYLWPLCAVFAVVMVPRRARATLRP